MDRDAAESAAIGVFAVPSLVVDGKYIINMGVGRKQALANLDALIEELLAQTHLRIATQRAYGAMEGETPSPEERVPARVMAFWREGVPPLQSFA